jgi:NAD(P)-dependent dehydrogenase (short-subunit alcohol dehydrogenase family)
MVKEFEGKIVVVTGGSGGIGGAIAAAFAADGAQTVLVARGPAELESAAAAIANRGGPVPTSWRLTCAPKKVARPCSSSLPSAIAAVTSWLAQPARHVPAHSWN